MSCDGVVKMLVSHLANAFLWLLPVSSCAFCINGLRFLKIAIIAFPFSS